MGAPILDPSTTEGRDIMALIQMMTSELHAGAGCLQPCGIHVPFELQPPVSQADRRKPPVKCAPACRINRKKIPLLDCLQDDFFQAFGDLN